MVLFAGETILFISSSLRPGTIRGSSVENNFLAITSAMMVTLNQNLADIGTHKELIVLNILKYKYCVNQSHVT